MNELNLTSFNSETADTISEMGKELLNQTKTIVDNYMNTTYFLEQLNQYNNLIKQIGTVVNYPDLFPIAIHTDLNSNFEIDNELLYLYNKEGEIQEEFTISSESNKGDKLFDGIYGEYRIMLVYIDKFENCFALFLNKNNEIKNEN